MDDDDPSHELALPAAIRDLIAGVALIALGFVTGTTSFDGRADGIDYAFDVLGVLWILWAILRFMRTRAPA